MTCLPPGGMSEIVIAFDTTGPLSTILDVVSTKLQDTLQRLQTDIPGIGIGLIAHGDFCDPDTNKSYDIRYEDIKTDVEELCEFVSECVTNNGRDSEESYTFFTGLLCDNLTWTPGSQRAVVIFADAQSRGTDFYSEENAEWKEELEGFVKMVI